jgi:tetratricopeptide (TPR) repeat protein
MKKKELLIEADAASPGQWIFPAAVALITFLVFFRALSGGFVSLDDASNFLGNSAYRGLGWTQVRWMATTTLTGVYQPLAWLTFGLDYLFWGMNPFGYHLTSVLIHSANAALYYCLCFRLIAWNAPAASREERLRLAAISACAALGFSLHPLRVESVAWITERRDVLSGFFYLSTILAYLSRRREGRSGAGALPLALFAASLLAKGSGIGLPATLVALDVFPLKRLPWNWRGWLTPEAGRALREKIPFLLLSLAAAGVGVAGQRSAGNFLSWADVGGAARGAQTLLSIAFYLRKTVMPARLMPDYERPAHLDLLSSENMFGAAVAIAFLALVFVLRKRRPAATSAGIHYLAALAPVIGVFQFGANVVADRYSYLPCLAWPILGAGWAAVSWESLSSGARFFLRAGAVAVLAALGCLTWRQIGIWHDSNALWTYVLTLQPGNILANNNLGADLLREGRLEEAEALLRRSLDASPTVEAYGNLADLLAAKGRLGDAEACDLAALTLDPSNASVNSRLAMIYARENRMEEAVARWRRALQKNPADADSRNNLGLTLARMGRLDEALPEYRESLRLNPRGEVYANLADALARLGRREEALALKSRLSKSR